MEAYIVTALFLGLVVIFGMILNGIVAIVIKDSVLIDGDDFVCKKFVHAYRFPIDKITSISINPTSELGICPQYLEVSCEAEHKKYHNIIPVEKYARRGFYAYNFDTYYSRLRIINELIRINPKIILNDDLLYFVEQGKLPEKYYKPFNFFGIKSNGWG